MVVEPLLLLDHEYPNGCRRLGSSPHRYSSFSSTGGFRSVNWTLDQVTDWGASFQQALADAGSVQAIAQFAGWTRPEPLMLCLTSPGFP